MIISSIISGILIGIAVVIPGLSASVFLVVTGNYDKIIFSISNIKNDFKKEFLYLLPIAVGGILGILLSTKLVIKLSTEYPLHAYSFFVGLVLGSLPFIIKKLDFKNTKPVNVVLALAGFLFILLLGKLEADGSTAGDYIAVTSLNGIGDIGTMLFAGALSCSLMTIPGVSGSVLLMVIGQYNSVYNSVAKVTDFLVSILKGDIQGAMANLDTIFVIIPFAIGAVLGVFFIAKFLAIAIEKYSNYLYSFVIGVILAAIVVLFNTGVIKNSAYFSQGFGTIPNILFCIILVGIGYFCTTKFENPEE